MPNQQPSSKEQFHQVLRAAKTATLSVLDFETHGPFATLVNIAIDNHGLPLFLFSGLSRHTKCILADSRGSVLVADRLPATGDALTAFRATITGTLEPVSEPTARETYLQHHPAAEMYVDFGDFAFWRLQPLHVFIVAGFGRVVDFPAAVVFELS